MDKVAVVIDPLLTKVLRPHQVEGVKVCPLRSLHDHRLHGLVVLVQMHHGHVGREPVWLYHGGRDGSWEDPSVHCTALDAAQAITTSWEADDREMHHRMSLKSGEELGERVW